MAVINTGLLTKGLRSEFFSRLNATPTVYERLCTRMPSNADQETYKWLGNVPRMRQWVGPRVAKGLTVDSYTVANLKYEATMEVDRDEISDDQTGQIRIRVQELAQRAALHKDYLLATLLENGATAGYTSYDGQVFFGNGHTASQDNDISVACTTGTEPTVTEMLQAIKESVGAMIGFKDASGEPFNVGMGGIVVVTPPTNYYLTALEAMRAQMVSSSDNPVMRGIAEVVALPYLTSTSADNIYVLKTDGVVRPFIFQDREPVEFGALAEGSSEEFLREKYLYGVRARYRVTYGQWAAAVRVTFT
jgi:phage major head subunit gpT-like protein